MFEEPLYVPLCPMGAVLAEVEISNDKTRDQLSGHNPDWRYNMLAVTRLVPYKRRVTGDALFYTHS